MIDTCARHIQFSLVYCVIVLMSSPLSANCRDWVMDTPGLGQETAATPDAPPPTPPEFPKRDPEPPEKSGGGSMKLGDMIETEGPGVVPPVPVKVPQPRYSSHAMRKRARGRVIVGVLVDEHGKVTRVVIKKGHLDFNLEAEKAARQAIFKPATKDGIAGKMWTELRFTFQPN